jgi:DNA helicase-2/ATP-dependent DNA helicase PcrA
MTLKLIKTELETLAENSILDKLNDSQKLAVTSIEGPVLIIAGAGSGKTRALTHRIAYMINQGIRPENILALTFTNKAAEEMGLRIASLVHQDAVKRIWSGTFHSIFARILRIEAESIGYTRSFSIYDTDDSANAIKDIIRNMGISTQQFTPQTVRGKISSAKNQMLTWDKFTDLYTTSNDRTIADIYKEYEENLKRSNAMDFDDLLINMIRILRNDTATLKKYQERFKYLLVDEYQDTNRPQYLVCKMLAEGHKNICVVGDDAQSIYKWRGADIKNILDFQKDYDKPTIIRLEQNYRSTKNILSAADSVIKNNRKQISKDLWTDNPDGDKIRLVECIDEIDEAEFIIKNISNKIQHENISAKDFAILYRTNAQSLAFENSCRKHNTPYIIVGGMSFYKRKEVKDVYSYLKFISNPKDNESLVRIINEPPRGIGQQTLSAVRLFAKSEKISIYEAFQKIDSITDLASRGKNSIKVFTDFVNEILVIKSKTEPSEFASQFIEKTGLLQMYKEIDTEDSIDRWNNVQQVLSDIATFFRMEPDKELEDYLQQVSLISDIDDKDINRDQIKLMTIHSAKGLEFPVVFIAGLEKGLFPFARTESNREEEEEERRLFYVAITRAMETLYLTYATRRMRFGEYNYQNPSKFISEIDSKLIDFNTKPTQQSIVQPRSKLHGGNPYRPKADNYSQVSSNDSYSQIPENELKLKSGDRVKHSVFGPGKIESISGTPHNLQATVYFQTVGRKKLMLQYAKLEKI